MSLVKPVIFSAPLLLIFFGLPLFSRAADAADISSPSAIVLSPEARALFERGVSAAKKSPADWNLAIASFTQAQDVQPLADAFPPLVLNLGLTHAGSGHELAALYWLQAYLIAAPDAQNVPAVRDLVARERAALEAKLATILDHARRAIEQFPQGAAREWASGYVESVYARFEALTRRDIASAIQRRPADASYLWQEYGRMLASLGDVSGALAAVDKIQNPPPSRPWGASGAVQYVYALPTYTGRRDDVRLAILDALESSGAEDARLRTILAAFDNPDLSLKWQAQRALVRNRAAEATSLAGSIGSTDIRDALLQTIVDHYLDADWKNPSRFSLARDAVAKISTPQARDRATVSLIYMALSVDDTATARAVAQAARNAAPQADLPFLIDIVLDNRAVLAPHAHSQAYFIVSFAHHVLRGEFEDARRVADAVRREMKSEDVTKYGDVESNVFAHALATRVSGLLSQRKLEAARTAAARFPRAACDGDVSRSLTPNGVVALRNHIATIQRIADEEITGGHLDAAAATVRSMPTPAGEPGLLSPCVAEKAEEMTELARAYLARGRSDQAKPVVAEIRSLVWRGALDRLVLRRLADLQQDLGDTAGAAATRRMEMFVPLTYWVWGARTFSEIPVVLDLSGALQKVSALAGAGVPSPSERPDMDMTRGMVDTAARLSAWLQDYDVSIRQIGGRERWTSAR